MDRLLIKGGTLVDSAGGYCREKRDIMVENGLIKEISPEIRMQDCPVLDAAGKLVSPGMIDIHIHTRGGDPQGG